MVTGLLALAAPLPFPRPPAPVHAGDYTLSWHGSPYEVLLRPDGVYECRRGTGELAWVGGWEAKAGVVTVREYSASSVEESGEYPPPGFPPYRWDAPVLAPKHKGERPPV